ncbi:MAG: cytochrome P450 [Acidobacteria bacterium]|nr:cytochrome P450 [Acidobacteriota bacterium]
MSVVPGPPAIPLLGNLPSFLADKLGFLSRCAAEFGDVVRLHIGAPTYLLTNPTDIKHVLVDNGTNYTKTSRLTSPSGKRLSGSGMQTSTGAEHLRQRRMLQPAFQRPADAFFNLMMDRTDRAMASWTDGSELNLASEMERLALSIILGALFGTEFHDEQDQLAKAITVRRAYIEYFYSALGPFPEYWPLPIVFRYRRAMALIDAVIELETGRVNPPRHTFASRFQTLQYGDGSRMSQRQVRDEILTLMSTGYETIGDALSWTFYLLARNPSCEQAVVDEVNALCQGRTLRVEDIPKLTYTRSVLEESMRLYPPTWIFVRVALDTDRLPSGAAIERGAKIYLCQYVTQRLAKYFPDPERFDPGRFHGESRAAHPRFSYFPFGGGVRQCIGEQFALLEGVAVLATIVPRFRFELLQESVTPRPTITLRPKNGIRAIVRRR